MFYASLHALITDAKSFFGAGASSGFLVARLVGSAISASSASITFAFALGAIIRGICVGIVAYLTILIFVPLGFHNFFIAFAYLFLGCALLGLLGVLCGVLSDTFDQMSAMTSYVITPLTFLSGTFYSTNALPEFWKIISHFNPFFYMIDGFRYGITGHNDGNLMIGAIYILTINIILGFIIYRMLKIGYRIKS